MTTSPTEKLQTTRFRPLVVLIGLLTYGLVVFADYITTEEISLSIFYLFPIG